MISFDQYCYYFLESYFMSFARDGKKLNEQQVFNPPPGYYDYYQQTQNNRHASSFGHSERFVKT